MIGAVCARPAPRRTVIMQFGRWKTACHRITTGFCGVYDYFCTVQLMNLKYNLRMKNSSIGMAAGRWQSVLFCTAALLVSLSPISAQEQIYDNFEGSKVVKYGERFGVLDSAVKNPAPNTVNNSATCALYVRNGSKKFANIKMSLDRKLTGLEKYATYEGIPPRLKMKVYTTAPAGTLVEVLLGSKRGNNDYPAGTHSQYQAYTSTSGEWEEIEFKFSQVPQGSETGPDQIDQIVLLFNPNSSTSDSYYFDDLTGPGLDAAAPAAEEPKVKPSDKKESVPQGKKKKGKEKSKTLTSKS